MRTSKEEKIESEQYNHTRAYFVGEVHGVKENTKIKYELIEFLVLHKNVRTILVEIGYCDCIGVNEYIKSGNIEILYKVMNSYQMSYANADVEIKFWEKIYDLNQRLSVYDRINAVGVDCNGDMSNVFRYIVYLLHKKNDSLSLEFLDLLYDYKTMMKERNYLDCLKIVNHLEKKIEYLDNKNFTDSIIDNLIRELIAHGLRIIYPSKRKEIREEYIYNRIKKELSRSKTEGNIFGQFGYNHIFSKYGTVRSAIERCIESCKDRVVRIILVYTKCEYYIIKDNQKHYSKIDTTELLLKNNLEKIDCYSCLFKDKSEELYYMNIGR